MTRLVVDASVAVKWYLPEDHTEAATRLLDEDVEAIVPELIFAEIGNAVWKRWRRDEVDDAEVDTIITALDAVPFTVHPVRPLLPLAVDLSVAHGSQYMTHSISRSPFARTRA